MPWRPSPGETRAVAIALGIKTLVAALMILFASNYMLLADTFGLHAYFDLALNTRHRWYTGNDTASWYLPLLNWDSQHYLLLSDYGYNHGYDKTSGQQFYPLYPLLIRIFSLVLPPVAAATVLNYIFVAGIAVYLYRLAEHFQCPRPHLATLFVMTYPTAFFTAVAYNEALFLFLFMGFVCHFMMTRHRVYLVYLALLPMTRGAAAFVFGGLVLYAALQFLQYLRARHAALKNMQRQPAPQMPPPFAWRDYAYCLLAYLAGVGGYLLFFWISVGDPFAGITAQDRYPTGNSIANLFDPRVFLNNLSGVNHVGKWFYPYHAWFDWTILLITLVIAASFFAVREWALLCFYFTQIYGHAAMGPISGFSRYTLLAMPFFALALAKHARSPLQSWLVVALCAVGFSVQLYLAARHSVNIWVS